MSSADWSSQSVVAADAVSHLRSGMNIFVHGASATPTPLLEALCARDDLADLKLYHMHTAGPAPFVDPACRRRITSVSLFTGAPVRKAVEEGRADFIPVFLSDIPALFRNGRIRIDAALLQLSPPDKHGLCSLGTSIDVARAAADCAPLKIAEINRGMPRTHGDTSVPLRGLQAWLQTDRPPHEHPPTPESPVEAAIGEQVARLVEDGATVQTGIGAIPDAVLARLANKCELGIHTEMFSDRVVDLVEGGVVTNRRKSIFRGQTVTSFVTGTKRLFDFVDDNPDVEFYPSDVTNDTNLLRKLDKLTAVNSALQIDLTGQVCADSIGHRIYSGIGGQMDFMRGAALSPGGKAIIALPSTAVRGTVSRIVAELAPGAGVVTTRGHVHWVVTEYGAVDLHGLSLRQRGEALISIAHPDFRAELSGRLREIRHFC
ncbi:MAG: acetyl-CoA hydrolase/transferase family protein [Planctomycetaceae bacterium]|nr:acetyl-CoA hydrolase/transferase family protein [Planctomycetaceae bacterium]